MKKKYSIYQQYKQQPPNNELNRLFKIMQENINDLELDELPIHKQLISTLCQSFALNPDILSGVLLGSLANQSGDRVSNLNLLFLTSHDFHSTANQYFEDFEKDKDIFYSLDGNYPNYQYCFKKYIFHNISSAEIHCISIDSKSPIEIKKPFKILFDKKNLVRQFTSEKQAPKPQDLFNEADINSGLTWELFNCIKWIKRNDSQSAKNHLKKLIQHLEE